MSKMLCEFCQLAFSKKFLQCNVIMVYIFYLKYDDFTGKTVRFNDETLRFKREQTCEIDHASCLNVNGGS